MFQGKVDTKNSTSACEFTGIITQVGSLESEFKLGDRVVVMAPTSFGTFAYVPEWACCRLRDNESLQVDLSLSHSSTTAHLEICLL